MKTLDELGSMQGRTAIITGAGGHLGRVMIEALAERSADFILLDKPGQISKDFVKNYEEKFNVSIKSIEIDLEYEIQRNIAVEQILNSCQEINCLINNAAFGGGTNLDGWLTNFQNQSIRSWRRGLEVNLTAPFHLAKALSERMSQSVGANIINITSIYGEYGPDWSLYESTSMGNPAAYAASKGGLAQLTRWMATTLAPRIRVNAVSPGGIYRNQPDLFVQRYVNRVPLTRMATEEDFKGIVAFLASDLSAYVTGEVMRIDGGWGVW
jgi:NAD(P)-dependent dehydrogenase (short-subunit alcohol dehydrogenase family)